MSHALLAFRPEAHGSDGDNLLFGVSVPKPMPARGLSPLEQLNLASLFLESQPAPDGRLLEHIIRRASTAHGQPVQPRIAASLLPRLMRAAALVHDALRSGDASKYPLSAEGIFGTELEGLSPEDQEFESARRFVQFADELTRIAARGAPTASPHLLASQADAKQPGLAPGLARALGPSRAARRAVRVCHHHPTGGTKSMHDIDRTQLDFQQQPGAFRAGAFSRTISAAARSRSRRRSSSRTNYWRQQRAGTRTVPGRLPQQGGQHRQQYRALADRQAIGGVLKGSPRRPCRWPAARSAAIIGGPLGAQIGSGLANAAGRRSVSRPNARWQRRGWSSTAPVSSCASPPIRRSNAVAAAQSGADPRKAAQSAAMAAANRSLPACSLPRAARRWASAPGAPSHGSRRCQLRPLDSATASTSCSTGCEPPCRSAPPPRQMLAQEARALLTRLDRLRPFALVEPMVPAAGLFPNAQSAIERTCSTAVTNCAA